ncbi:MAG: hypothetical protein A2016_04080 [Elusimicrobia bacterium GWF2_62_30]|nr:MAG: hypothetical protein A2016_04080 [Elusimicrobia bacterium GWF2_62_30]
MRRKFILRLALIGTLAGCLACKGKETSAAAPAEVSTNTITAVVKTEKAPPAGSYVKRHSYFKLPSVAGGEIDLADHAGKPVMVMFFTETCPYCRKAAPYLEKIYQAYKPKITVIGVCIQDDPQAPKNFAADLGTTFPMVYGGRDLYRQYKAQGVPFIYLLDKEHEPKKVWPGFTDSFYPEMTAIIDSLLAAK